MTGHIIWLTLIALVCMIGDQTNCETFQYFYPDTAALLTHDDLIDKLGTMFETPYDDDRTPAELISEQVFLLLVSTSPGYKRDNRLNGFSVNELISLNTWDIHVWKEFDFDKRKRICDTYIPKISEFDPYDQAKTVTHRIVQQNLRVYCTIVNDRVFNLVRYQLAELAAHQLSKKASFTPAHALSTYEEVLRQFYYEVINYAWKRNTKSGAINITLEVAIRKVLHMKQSSDREELKAICSEVLERFAIPFGQGGLRMERDYDWANYYNYCKIVNAY